MPQYKIKSSKEKILLKGLWNLAFEIISSFEILPFPSHILESIPFSFSFLDLKHI